jgi:hypothetical protein
LKKCNRAKKTGKCTAKRAVTAHKYEKMKEGEMPEFHIFRWGFPEYAHLPQLGPVNHWSK